MRLLRIPAVLAVIAAFVAPAAAQPGRETGPCATMSAELEKTFFGIDVMKVNMRFDDATADQFARIARGKTYSPATARALAGAALSAKRATVEITMQREVGYERFLNEAHSELKDAFEAGAIEMTNYRAVRAELGQWFEPLRQRGLKAGDVMTYDIHDGTVEVTVRGERGELLIRTKARKGDPGKALLATYLAETSDLRQPLLSSLFAGDAPCAATRTATAE